MIRATTSGTMKSYRVNLNNSTLRLNSARNTVLTERNFNSYAEDPSAAAQSFQLRRSFQQVDNQLNISEAVTRKFNTAYSAIDHVVMLVDNTSSSSALSAIIYGANDPTGSGRTALGQELLQIADSIVETMNCKYGDHFVFSGANGLDVAFTWEGEGENRQLLYRGIPVDVAYDANNPTSTESQQYATLEYISTHENRFVDIGIGLKEDEVSGNLIETSAFNSVLQGINALGFGTDEDGDPKNIATLIYRMGTLLTNCDENTGAWASDEDREDFRRLIGKFETSATELKKNHVALTTKADYLAKNQALLEDTAYTLNEQILEIEQCDLADAITSFSWAQYCYNAALKMGNSILSESLMDYIQ